MSKLSDMKQEFLAPVALREAYVCLVHALVKAEALDLSTLETQLRLAGERLRGDEQPNTANYLAGIASELRTHHHHGEEATSHSDA